MKTFIAWFIVALFAAGFVLAQPQNQPLTICCGGGTAGHVPVLQTENSTKDNGWLSLTPSVTWTGGPSSANSVLNLTETFGGSATDGFPFVFKTKMNGLNLINVTGDAINTSAAGQGWVAGLLINDQFGGSSAIGARGGLISYLKMTTATGNRRQYNNGKSFDDGFYLSGFFVTEIGANDGGTTGQPYGQAYGFGSLLLVDGTATNWNNAFGAEIDTAVKAGASVAGKVGVANVLYGDDVHGHGLDADAGEVFSTTTAATWNTGIQFGYNGGWWPFNSNSTLIKLSGPKQISYGIDFANGTFSGAAYRSPNFSVDGSGNVTGNAYNVGSTAGVSCSGAPSTSFKVTNGIVTHC
jgi:hypothetical protein